MLIYCLSAKKPPKEHDRTMLNVLYAAVKNYDL